MQASDSVAISHNPEQGGQASADEALERRIECARVAMTLATDELSRRDHFERMRELIAQRSPLQVERMERERGLR